MQIIRNEIQIPTGFSQRLEEEFKTSKQSVYNALKDHTQSELAKKIRLRAKEMMIEQITGLII